MIRPTRLFVSALAVLMLAASPAQALTVFDPSNYSQNVLQAARALQQINNQIRGLQNQVLMLQNMAKHLERLDYLNANGRAPEANGAPQSSRSRANWKGAGSRASQFA